MPRTMSYDEKIARCSSGKWFDLSEDQKYALIRSFATESGVEGGGYNSILASLGLPSPCGGVEKGGIFIPDAEYKKYRATAETFVLPKTPTAKASALVDSASLIGKLHGIPEYIKIPMHATERLLNTPLASTVKPDSKLNLGFFGLILTIPTLILIYVIYRVIK